MRHGWFGRGARIERKLEEALGMLRVSKAELRIIQMEGIIMAGEIEALKANVAALISDVAAQGTVIGSAVTAIKGLTDQMTVLSQQLADAIAANDPVAIQEASDAIAAQNQAIIDQTAALAAAIPENTK